MLLACRSLALLIAMLPLSAAGAGLPPLELVRDLRRARIASLEGDPARGLEILRDAVDEHPGHLAPSLALLDHERRFGLPPEEAARLRAGLRSRLADSEHPIPPGLLAYLTTDPDAGPDELELVLEAVSRRDDPTAPDARLLRSIVLLHERLQRPEQARQALERLLALAPTAELRWRAIRIDRALERWDRVAAQLALLLEQDPDPYTRMSYIEALSRLGDLEAVTEQLALLPSGEGPAAMSMRGPVHELLLEIAWALRDRGAHGEAEAIFRRLLEADPDSNEARAAILHLYGTEEERREHEAALATRWDAEEDADALLAQGSTLLAGGDAAAAIALLRRAAAALPDSEIAWYNLGLAALTLELWPEAEAAWARTAEINPSRGDAWLNRGVALYELDRCEEAIPVLGRALERGAQPARTHYFLHACHRMLGHADEARRHLVLYESAR